jgi:hypothetical protein
MIIDSWRGLTLHVDRIRWGRLTWWRRSWEWSLVRGGRTVLSERAWTRRQATAHGEICRALRLAADSPLATRRSQDDLEGWRHG